MANQNQRISISLDEELYRKVTAETTRTGKSVAQIAREAMELYLTQKLMNQASLIQAPLEDKVNNLIDDQNYLKNMIEGIYRSVNFLAQLEQQPSLVKRLGETSTVAKTEEVLSIARKRANQSYSKMKRSSLTIGDYLEEFLQDANAYEEDDEEPKHQLSREELDATRRKFAEQMLASKNFAQQMNIQSTPPELDKMNKEEDKKLEPQSEQPTKEEPRKSTMAENLIKGLFAE